MGWSQALTIAIAATLASPLAVNAGTDIRIMAADQGNITARTMDFQQPLNSRLVIQPRNGTFSSPAPDGAMGVTWTGKYGFVYVDALGLNWQTDGLNEAGLGLGALYLPGATEYQTIGVDDRAIALSNLQFGAWILSQFATVEEVRLALSTIKVWGEPLAVWGDAPIPLHYVIHDANGNSLIVEFIEGTPRIYENEVDVLTNAPSYEWHLANLRNYGNLSPVTPSSADPLVTAGVTGQGSGWLGLPGDPAAPSRFVNGAKLLAALPTPATTASALAMAQAVINRFVIPVGWVQAATANGPVTGDYTQWLVLRDHVNRVFYWRTDQDMALRSLNLSTLNFEGTAKRRVLPLAAESPVVGPMVDPTTFTEETAPSNAAVTSTP